MAALGSDSGNFCSGFLLCLLSLCNFELLPHNPQCVPVVNRSSGSMGRTLSLLRVGLPARLPMPLSSHRAERTSGGAEASRRGCAGLSLQPVWETRTRKELRDPLRAQVSGCWGACRDPPGFPSLLPPGDPLPLETSRVGGGSLGPRASL